MRESIHTIHNHTYHFVHMPKKVYVRIEIHVYKDRFTHTHTCVHTYMRVAVCCSMLQCDAVRCSVLQCVPVCSVCCSELQRVVVPILHTRGGKGREQKRAGETGRECEGVTEPHRLKKELIYRYLNNN